LLKIFIFIVFVRNEKKIWPGKEYKIS
jgi:hypothetical protein